MRPRFLAGLAVAATFVVAEPAQAQCAVGFTQVFFAATYGCYTLTPSAGTWTAAQSTATTLGGYLAAIGSAAENTAVRGFANSQGITGSVWIGFTDQATEGLFVWVNGEPVVYTNWNGGEPNNSGDEDFTEMQSSGGWNDLSNTGGRRGIVEQSISAVPEPATIALMTTGLIAVAGVARRKARG